MGKKKDKRKSDVEKQGKRGTKRTKPEAENPEHEEQEEENPLLTDSRFREATWDPRFSNVPKKAKGEIEDDRFTTKLQTSQSFRDTDTPVDRFGRPKNQTPAEVDEDDEEEEEEGEDDDDDIDDEYDEYIEDSNETSEAIPRGKATRRLAVVGLDWSVTRSVDILASLGSFCPTGKIIESVEVHPSKFGLERLTIEAKLGPQVISKDDMKVIKKHQNQNQSIQKQTKHEEEQEDDKNEEEDQNNDDDEDDEDDEDEYDDEDEKLWKQQLALRKYEEERLKYYYAIVKFEDIQSADAVYEQCDGVEYAQSGRSFDLRFIPDDFEIDTKPRDHAETVPDGYAPPNVNLSSLNNSTVKLSWDADPPDRMILKKKAFGRNELNQADLKAYLASSSESEADVEDAEKKEEIEKKRNLLLGIIDGNDDDDDDDDVDLQVTFEPGMLEKGEDILKRKLEKDQRQDETEWEARLRRLQEKKSEKRKQRREFLASKGEEEEDDDDDSEYSEEEILESSGKNANEEGENPTFSDPFFSESRDFEEEQRKSIKKSKDKVKTKKREQQQNDKGIDDDDEDDEVNKQKKGELELLMMEDTHLEKKNTIANKLARLNSDDEEEQDDRRNKRKGKSRGKRRWQKEKENNDKKVSTSVVDVEDKRFQNVFESHLFAIDPTHPKYKPNESTKVLMEEKGKRDRKKEKDGSMYHGNHHNNNNKGSEEKHTSSRKDDNNGQSELLQLAARAKARAKAKNKSSKTSVK